MSTPAKSSHSPSMSYLLMGLMLLFGVGSAAVVLVTTPSGHSVAIPASTPAQPIQPSTTLAKLPPSHLSPGALPALSPVALVRTKPTTPIVIPAPVVKALPSVVRAPPARQATQRSGRSSARPAIAPNKDTVRAKAKAETSVEPKPDVVIDTSTAFKRTDLIKKDTPKQDAAKSEAASVAIAAEKPAPPSPAETKPVVKSLIAPPLVPSSVTPSVVAVAGERAWVRLDDQKTVIVTKGQTVPGLGVFQGHDAKGAKFDSGTVPVAP